MVKKAYNWKDATLGEHSKIKHKIFRQYFKEYLITRCPSNPHQTNFTLAVVDGFAGAGRYKHGEPGSPIIFMEALIEASEAINLRRTDEGLSQVEIGCLFIFNDSDKEAIKMLKENVAPFEVKIKSEHPNLHVKVEYMSQKFEKGYPQMKDILEKNKIGNILLVLDQYGDSAVKRETINNIMTTWKSPEVFLTFAIGALKTYCPLKTPENISRYSPRAAENLKSIINGEQELISKAQSLGLVERSIFMELGALARFVTPFAIHNPDGWHYWLLHFANSYRARQVYNNILHSNSHAQVHVGRSGLDMLSVNPRDENQTYFFGEQDRKNSINALHKDIPEMIALHGNAMNIRDFFEIIYNDTPAHSDNINEVLIKNDNLEVITKNGRSRRTAKRIDPITDTVRLKKQPSFFFPPKPSREP